MKNTQQKKPTWTVLIGRAPELLEVLRDLTGALDIMHTRNPATVHQQECEECEPDRINCLHERVDDTPQFSSRVMAARSKARSLLTKIDKKKAPCYSCKDDTELVIVCPWCDDEHSACIACNATTISEVCRKADEEGN